MTFGRWHRPRRTLIPSVEPAPPFRRHPRGFRCATVGPTSRWIFINHLRSVRRLPDGWRSARAVGSDHLRRRHPWAVDPRRQDPRTTWNGRGLLPDHRKRRRQPTVLPVLAEIDRMARSGRWDFQSHTRKMHARMPIDARGDLASELSHRRWLSESNRLETLSEFEFKIGRTFAHQCRTSRIMDYRGRSCSPSRSLTGTTGRKTPTRPRRRLPLTSSANSS